jgi:plasmid stability protein
LADEIRCENAMTLTLNLPPALEESLRQQAAASGMEVEAFVIEAVRSKVGKGETEPTPKRIPTEEELDALFEDIAKLNPPVTTFVDDSRESIYD